MDERTDHPAGNRHMLVPIALAGVIVVALGVGFVAGYLTGSGGQARAASAPASMGPGQASTAASGIGARVQTVAPDGAATPGGDHGADSHGAAGCSFDLPEKDRYILAGLTCNCDEPPCHSTPLLSCHCDTAHAMKTLTKQLIVEGMDPKQIPVELEKRWGKGIRPGT